MGVTAKSRATTRLSGSTKLAPDEVLAIIKEAAGAKLGGGTSLMTTGVVNIGANVKIVREQGSTLTLSMTSGKQLVELCTFSASVQDGANGGSKVRVGGLETYKTSQEKLLFVIPAGPKMITGMGPYKKLLRNIEQSVRQRDASASLSITQTEA